MTAIDPAPRVPGYRGIWFTLGQFGEYGDKYSGGLGTYTAKHLPMAIHAPQAGKTFFVYGGTPDGGRRLLCMASYYDHASGRVPRPAVVHDKGEVDDPHDNPSLCLAPDGHVWVFVSGRGRKRPGYKYRSAAPYSVDAFERVSEEEMTYPQPWWTGDGLLHLFTKYTGVRELYWNASSDGRAWSAHRKLAGMGGHYQVSNRLGRRVATAFNMHPEGNVDRRTNLYYAETGDCGETWKAADGTVLQPPLEDAANPALVRDFAAEGRLVYMKDLQFDEEGNPAVLVVTSEDCAAGPKGGPRRWTLCRWRGGGWDFAEIARSTHNYDMGSLYRDAEGWSLVAPLGTGPQRWGTGGEMELWRSADGDGWERVRALTRDSPLNHAYARRPVEAHPGFYAFWADGHPDAHSPSRIYFTDRDGSAVWRLPYDMEGEWAAPERVEY